MKIRLLTLLFISFSFGIMAQTQIENPGFEEWEVTGPPADPTGFEEPVNWSSLKTATPDAIANVSPEVMFKSTDAHSGDFSIHLINVAVFGIVANGVITNGRILADFDPEASNTFTSDEDPGWYTLFEDRPDSLVGYYKYISVDGDAAQVQALLHAGLPGSIPQADSSNWVGLAKANLAAGNVPEWTRFSIPFVYFLDINPDYILLNPTSGDGYNAIAGSEMWLDDMELIYNVDGIDEKLAENLLKTYGFENTIVADLTRFGMGTKFELSIYDLTGKLVKSQSLESGSKYNIIDFQPGLYICSFQSSDGVVITKKVIVR
jgi:hypothetical protein